MITPSQWKPMAGTVGAMLLGGVLLVAAWAKAVEPGAFAEQIRVENLDFFFSATTVALIALALEVGSGLALLLGVRNLLVLAPTTLLVTFFIFLTSRNYWLVSRGLRDASESCGCFGSLLKRTPGEALWQDLLLLVAPLLLAWWGRRRSGSKFPRIRLALAAVVALGTVFVVSRNPDLTFVEMAARSAPAGGERVFRATSDYHLQVDGRDERQGRIYQSDDDVALLVTAPQLRSAVVVDPRTGTVERVEPDRLQSVEGRLRLRPGSRRQPEARFEAGPEGVAFQLDGHKLVLAPSAR